MAPSYETGTVTLVQNDSVVARLQVSTSGPRAAVLTGDKLYIAEEKASCVDILSLPDLTWLKRLPVGDAPSALAFDATSGKVYCTCEDDDEVVVIRTADDSVVARIPVERAPHCLAWDPVASRVYCGNLGSAQLTAIDCARDSVVATIPVGAATRRVVVNPPANRIYVACHDAGAFYVVDGRQDTIIATFETNGNPWIAVVDQTDNLVYCGSSVGGLVLCGAGDTLVGDIPGAFYVKGMCWNPVTNRVYVAQNYEGEILAIDGASRSVMRRIPVAEYPAELVSVPGSRRAYACHLIAGVNTHQVSVLEGDSLLATLEVRPRPVDLCADSQRVYVLSWESSCVTVIRDGPVGIGAEASRASGQSCPRATFLRDVLRLPRTPVGSGRSAQHLYDAEGRMVLKLGPGDNDAGALAPGVYFMPLQSDSGPALKFVKQ
jgi:YVTN family beta-propeller protein